MSYLELSPEEAKSRSTAKSRVRQAKRPDAVDLSDDAFVRAWQLWDAAPSSEETTEAYLVETRRVAAEAGVTCEQFTVRLVTALLSRDAPPLTDGYYVWPTSAREEALACARGAS